MILDTSRSWEYIIIQFVRCLQLCSAYHHASNSEQHFASAQVPGCKQEYGRLNGEGGPTLLRQPALELIDDISISHKGQRIVVHPHIHPKLDVQPVALCYGGQVGALASDVQVTPAGHSSLDVLTSCSSPMGQGIPLASKDDLVYGCNTNVICLNAQVLVLIAQHGVHATGLKQLVAIRSVLRKEVETLQTHAGLRY